MSQSPTLDSSVRGQWAILNPPGDAKLAFDFLAVDDQKSFCQGMGLLRHMLSTISVGATLASEKPVFEVMVGAWSECLIRYRHQSLPSPNSCSSGLVTKRGA